VPFEQSAANIAAIVAEVTAPRVVLSTIVPLNSYPREALLFNLRLAGLAARSGWELVDASVSLRAKDGTWLPGFSDDGVHPNVAGAAVLGTALQAALAG
jgi:lysophospholipase L1-like esterase